MASALRFLTQFFLLCGLLTSTVVCVDEQKELIATTQKAQYLLEELQKSMSRISYLQRRSTLAQNGAYKQGQDTPTADFLFNSFLAFCHLLQGYNERSGNVTWPEQHPSPTPVTVESSTSSHSKTDYDADEQRWSQPEVRPLSVNVTREDDEIQISFLVKHSVPVRIRSLGGFDMENVYLNDTSDPGSPSYVRFTFSNSSNCEEEYEIERQFHFQARDQPTPSLIIRLDVCRFDLFQNTSVPWDDRKWEVRPGPFAVDIDVPKIRFTSGILDRLSVQRGGNETIDMIVVLDEKTTAFIAGIFYDWQTKSMVSENYHLALDEEDGGKPRLVNMDGKHDQAMTTMRVEMLNTTISQNENDNTTTNNNDINGDISAPNSTNQKVGLRITLMKESEKLSGKLGITLVTRYGSYYNSTLVRSVVLYTEIRIQRPNRRRIFPKNKIFIQKLPIFFCNEAGNVNFETFGRNCSMMCSARGSKLRSVSISKLDSVVPIYRSRTFQEGEWIYLLVDVGPATPAVDGRYVCSITNAWGYTESKDFKLFTHGYPKVNTNQSYVRDLGNDTTEIKCTADSRLPVNITVLVFSRSKGRVRVDNATTATRKESVDPIANRASLTVRLPTDLLRYPARELYCEFDSAINRPSFSEYLPDIIPNYNPNLPKMVKEESSINNLGNGTAVVICTATGSQPLDIIMAIGGNSDRFRVDDRPEHVRLKKVTGKRTTVTLVTDPRNLMRWTSWLYCRARNEFGVDSIEFDLDKYIERDQNYLLFGNRND